MAGKYSEKEILDKVKKVASGKTGDVPGTKIPQSFLEEDELLSIAIGKFKNGKSYGEVVDALDRKGMPQKQAEQVGKAIQKVMKDMGVLESSEDNSSNKKYFLTFEEFVGEAQGGAKDALKYKGDELVHASDPWEENGHLYRLAHIKRDGKHIVQVMQSMHKEKPWRLVPGGWKPGQVLGQKTLTIDAGQKWEVNPPKEAWDDLRPNLP